MTLESRFDVRAADRRPIVDATAVIVVAAASVMAAWEQGLRPAPFAIIVGLSVIAIALTIRMARAPRDDRLLWIDPTGRLWLGTLDCSPPAEPGTGSPRPGRFVEARLAGAVRLGGWCWLDLRVPAIREVPPAAGVARRIVARFRAQSMLPGSRPGRTLVLLSRRPMAAHWPALMRWLVWHRRTGH